MPFEVGGAKCWRKHRRGDLIAAMHWVNGEPALIFAAANGSGGAYAVPLGSAYQYVRSDGYPEPVACACLAADVAEQLGVGQDKRTLFGITELLLDAVPDLLSMPPEPRLDKAGSGAVVGELVIKSGDRVLAEREIEEPGA
jgi:hypothetical protein